MENAQYSKALLAILNLPKKLHTSVLSQALTEGVMQVQSRYPWQDGVYELQWFSDLLCFSSYFFLTPIL